MLNDQVKNLTKEVVHSNRQSRKEKLEESLSKSTSLAFRALKPPPATLTGKVTKNGEVIYSPLEVLKEQRAILAHWWDEKGTDESLDNMPVVDVPKLISCDTLRAVSASFKTQTSCIDGMHPKHLSGTSESTLKGLALLFRCFEVQGQWPIAEQAVLTALIPKSDGGFRPIALFRTAFRIYAKCRSQRVKQWAEQLPDAQCNNSKGRWVGDSTWRMQIRAITSTARKHIEFLLDVRKAFEHVQRGQLLQEVSFS